MIIFDTATEFAADNPVLVLGFAAIIAALAAKKGLPWQVQK